MIVTVDGEDVFGTLRGFPTTKRPGAVSVATDLIRLPFTPRGTEEYRYPEERVGNRNGPAIWGRIHG